MNWYTLPLVATLLLLLLAESIWTIQLRGTQPWAMVLCKFKDVPNEPQSQLWFFDWMTDRRDDASIVNYFESVSNGMYSIRGSNVWGWYTLPYTRKDVELLALSDTSLDKYDNNDLKMYYKAKEVCSAEARAWGARLDPPRTIAVINDRATAVFCKENGVLLTPAYLLSSALTHEMAHSFYIGHSYSDTGKKVFPYSRLGEYDDQYDLMSTANAFMYDSRRFGFDGPGLNGPHLDFLGWLPMDRVYYMGMRGEQEDLFRLSPLSVAHRNSRDWLLIIIPYDRDDPQKVYTVEFRTPTGKDKGIGSKGAVVIHKIVSRNGHLYSYVITHNGGGYYELLQGTEWLQFLESTRTGGYRFIKVKVEQMYSNSGEPFADVRVVSTFSPSSCSPEELERRIDTTDNVCISQGEKTELERINKLQKDRTDDRGGCNSGNIHRSHSTSDNVCVTESELRAYVAQNARSARRQRFYADLKTYGLNACKPGYVWRSIDKYDYACVDEVRKQQIDAETRRSPQKTESAQRCRLRSVFREAFSGDTTCVSVQERSYSAYDNGQQKHRLKYYKFFNGVDVVT